MVIVYGSRWKCNSKTRGDKSLPGHNDVVARATLSRADTLHKSDIRRLLKSELLPELVQPTRWIWDLYL